MLGLFLIYFIGKLFYTLAVEYGKSKWGYAVLGIASYYAASIIEAMITVIIGELFFDRGVDDMNELMVSLISILFDILVVYLTYKLLEKRFKGETIPIVNDSNILDDELMS